MTKEELRFLKKEIDTAREYMETTLAEGDDVEHYLHFEDLLRTATVLWQESVSAVLDRQVLERQKSRP